MLEVRDISKYFGKLPANKNISFYLDKGEILGLIGPNGSGKTTLFNCISGYYSPSSGSVHFLGIDITKLIPHEICHLGIGRTFQIAKKLRDMTTKENVMVGAFLRTRDTKSAEKKAMEVLEFLELSDKSDYQSQNLTISDKKKLELARALATDPKLLLVDEVMGGLNSTERCITLLIIEHIMQAIMRISDRIIVLNHGYKIAEGPPENIVQSEEVIKAYLGRKYVQSRKS